MKQRFTKLLAAFALLVGLTIPMGMRGETYEILFKSASSDSNTDLGDTPDVTDVVAEGEEYVASFSDCSKMYVGVSGIKLGSSKANGTMNFTLATDYQSNIKTIKVISASYGSDSNTITLYNGTTSLGTITPGTDFTYTFSEPATVTSIKLTTSSKRAYITKIILTTDEGTTLEDSDLALVDAPVALNFDLYNNASEQTVSYTTSSTGAVTVSGGTGFVTTLVNETNKTITVTPVAVTSSAQTITVSQDADGTYDEGTVTFTVSVANSTPTVTVTYHAGVTGVADVVETPYQGSNYAVAANTFLNPGYAFTKWTTNADGTGIEYQPGATISNIQADIDLYAQWEVTNDVTYSFAFTEIGTTGWTNGYLNHDYTYTDGTTAYFYQSSKQNGTITDIPVTKEGPICIVMDDQEITGASFVCRQWGTKAQTITLWYSTDGGVNYTSTGVTSNNFSISSNNLPSGTNAVKITFSNTSNQVGVESATVTLAGSKHNIELASVQNGNISASPMQASEGQVVTLTATPDAGFVFGAWDVFKTGESSTKVTVTNNQFEMPDYDVTVSATFAASYTLTYSVNGIASTENYVQGSTIILPTPSQNIPYGFSFIGWTSDPNDVNNILPASYQVSNNATLYAVFSKMNIVTLTKDSGFKENGSYDTEETEYELEGITFGVNKVMQSNSGTIQFKSNGDGYIYNKDVFSNLVSIVGTQTGTHRDVTLKVGNSSNPTAGTTIEPATDGLVDTYDLSGGNYGYILLTNTSGNAVYYSSIALIFSNPDAVHCTRVYTKDITGYGDDHAVKNGWYLIASPVANDITPSEDNGFITDYYDLYSFNQAAELEWENHEVHSFDIESGHGYLYASSTNTTLVFAGTPYNGDGVVELNHSQNAEYDGFNLVGNPLATSATINLPFYKMNDSRTALTSKLESGTVAAMEGVFVYAYDETTQQAISSVAFTASRSRGNSNASVNIDVMHNGAAIDNAIVRFDEGRQLPKYQLFKNSTKLFITKNSKDYAIVNSEAQGEMPVNFKAEENGTYTLGINTENVEMNYLHLIDNMTGMDVDLLQTPSYTFDATTNDYTSRFRLVFSANDVNEQNAETFAFFSNGNWVVNNEGEATLQVIDVNGRIVSNETINGTVATSITATPGVYMLRLVNGNEVKTQKIVVR